MTVGYQQTGRDRCGGAAFIEVVFHVLGLSVAVLYAVLRAVAAALSISYLNFFFLRS